MKTGKEIALPNSVATPGVAAGRLPARAYQENFADLRPPLTAHEAAVAADRCYFCHDAPCVTACPTAIDIPLFVRQISTGTARAAAKTIFDRNILGGMCARACPTETLCEQACVREASEGKPVEIRVTGPGRTSRKGVWAGGDCVAAGDDLLVTAVAQGRDAAEDIHAALMD